MKKKLNKIHVMIVSIFLAATTFAYLPNSVGQVPPARPGHGAIPLTPAQLVKFHKTHFRIKGVHLNHLGLSRINMERARAKLRTLDQIVAAPDGQDIESVNDFGAATPQPITTDHLLAHAASLPAGQAGLVTLPAAVDNSKEPWFPPIGNQGSIGSCAAFSTTYYQLTYMNAMSKGLTVSNGDTTHIFSPKWTYNMMNYGGDNGSNASTNDDLLAQNGAVTWAQFPYDNNYLAWDLNTSDWQNALSVRANPVQYVQSASTSASDISTWITLIKQLLNNGYIVTFDTTDPQMGFDWQYTTVTQDTANPSIVGQHVAYQSTGSLDHSMNIVGYDDTLQWKFGSVTGTGAFKIANQWGNSNNYGMNAGFFWLAYDAVYPTSQIPGGPSSSSRAAPINDYTVYQLSVKPNYTPKLIAKFTVNTTDRGMLLMNLGTSAPTASIPAANWYSEALAFDGGNYAFNGTTTAVPATFVFDFTDLLPSTTVAQKYYLGMLNFSNTTSATLSSYQLIDLTNNTTNTAASLPGPVTNGQISPSISYTFNIPNPITASATASPSSGIAPVSVSFDASASSDSNGTITSYAWNFGDNTTGNGITATHNYSKAGTYNVILTVTDNQNATATFNLPAITVSPSTLIASATAAPTSGTAPLTVNFNGSASSDTNSTITSYSWNFGDGLQARSIGAGAIGSGGGAITSHVYQSAGNYTAVLTVTDALGATNSFTIPTTIQVLPPPVPPVAHATATPTTGTAPLTVVLDGATSSDSDSTITNYSWVFGDGNVGIGTLNAESMVHVYQSSGSYTAALTVTDALGLTNTYTIPTVINVATPVPPVASSTASPSSGPAPLTVNFNGSASSDSDSTIVAYAWIFGDGTTGSGVTTSHVYSTVGNYTAKLTVTDALGLTNSYTIPTTISVSPTPVAPSITTQPLSQTVTAPAAVIFTGAASGTPTPTYQWEVSTNGGSTWSAINGANSASYTISSTTTSLNSNEYELVASNGVLPAATSNPATLTVSPTPVAPSITIQPVSTTVTAPASVIFTGAASGTPTPTYQWEVSTNGGSSWSAISGATSASYTINSTTTSLNSNEYELVASNGVLPAASSNPATLTVNPTPVAPSITTQPMSATVTAPASVTFTGAASGTPSPTYQWEVSTNGGSTWSVINGATSASYTISSTTTSLNSNEYELVTSNGVSPAATSNAATLTVNPTPVAPSITTQPLSQTVTAPAAVTFTGAASGTPVPTYQWEVSTNGGSTWSAINGATSASYTISSTTTALSSNEYELVASNGVAPAATSNAATLTVNPTPVAPSITTQPLSQTVTAPAAVTFTGAASGTPTPTYQWEVSTNGGSTWSAINGATSASYTINSTTTTLNGNEYELVASNGVSPAATSNAAILTVNSPLAAPLGLIATGSYSNVALSWNTTTGATSYNVKKAATTGGPFTTIFNTANTSYSDNSVNNGTTYFYVVSALNAAGEGPNSFEVSATPVDNTPPSVPINLAATVVSAAQINLTWDPSSDNTGVTSYFIYRDGLRVASSTTPSYSNKGLAADTTYTYTVAAHDAAGNTSAQSSSVSATTQNLPPNLSVSAISTKSSVTSPGDVIALTSTAINTGGAKDGAFAVNFHLSQDNQYGGTDDMALVNTRMIVSLKPGASSTGVTNVAIPANTPAGNYYLCAALNVGSGTTVSVVPNSSLCSTATIQVQYPDVKMTSVSSSTTGNNGGPMTVGYTIQNQGPGNAHGFYIRFYLSTDTTMTTADTIVGTQYIASLAAGASVSGTNIWNVPARLPSGTYYIGAIANFNGVMEESDTTNNTLAGNTFVLNPGADLVELAVSSPANGQIGGNLTVTDTVANQGGTSSGAFYVGYYLSTTPTITTSNTKIGHRLVPSLLAGAENTSSTTVTLPTNLAPGTYYLGAIADFNSLVPETNETNNALTGNAIGVTPGADLTMTAVSAPASDLIGGSINVTDTVTNQGTTPSRGFYVGYYLSKNASITTSATRLGYRYVSALAAGASNTATTVWAVPTTFAPGTYTIGAIVDFNNLVAETDETNNVLAGNAVVISPGIDLTMTAVSGPSNAVRGSSIAVSTTAANIGTTTSTSFLVGIYLSTDATITTQDRLIGNRTISSLTAGNSNTAVTNVTVPAGLAPGTYRIGAIANYNNARAEINVNNNSLAGNTISITKV